MVRTRIAPSPTGDPHIGTAYTALFNYAFSRRNNGKFILRIEDTDRTRLVPEAEQKIIDSLSWLGTKWDEGPFRQSERLNLYQKTAKELVEKEAAYYCDCSSERLEEVRKKQQARGEIPRYDRKCRANTSIQKSKGGSFVVRLKVPEEGETSFDDLIKGKITFKNTDIDDAVILKSDGWPTYHLAVVVDDADMKISHVIRAEEWLSSTPKHVLIYQALGNKPPVFAHLPLLRNPDRSKISKRKNPISLGWYKQQGYLPEAIRNYLALMGWSMPDGKEIFSLEEFIKELDLSRVDSAGPVFDLQKLEWLNGEWIRSFSKKELIVRIKDHSKASPSEIEKVVPLIHERLKKLSEFDLLTSYFFQDEIKLERSQIVPKSYDSNTTVSMLQNVERSLSKIEKWDSNAVEKTLNQKPAELGWSKTDLFQTIRYIETGSKATPPLHETLGLIGKKRALSRLQTSVKLLSQRT